MSYVCTMSGPFSLHFSFSFYFYHLPTSVTYFQLAEWLHGLAYVFIVHHTLFSPLKTLSSISWLIPGLHSSSYSVSNLNLPSHISTICKIKNMSSYSLRDINTYVEWQIWMQYNKRNKESFIGCSGNTNESHQSLTVSGEMGIKTLIMEVGFEFSCKGSRSAGQSTSNCGRIFQTQIVDYIISSLLTNKLPPKAKANSPFSRQF